MNRPQAGVKAAARPASSATLQSRPSPKIGVAFAAIPLDVLRSRNLSPAARLAFAALANHARMRRGEVSTLTNRRLAEAAGLSIAAARRALDELESAGLIRRLFGPSKRIRVGVAITYAPAGEVAQPSATPAPRVAQTEQPGCAPTRPEVAQAGAADLLREREEDSESRSLAHQGTEETNPDGPAAAAYLRACVTAARLGLEMPAPPITFTATKAEPGTPPPCPNVDRQAVPGRFAAYARLDGRPDGRSPVSGRSETF